MAGTKRAIFNGNAEKHPNGNGHTYPQGSMKGADPVADEKTDIQRWRLLDERGRQTWHYLDSTERAKEWPQTTADRYFLGLDLVGRQFFTPTSIRHWLIASPHRMFPNFLMLGRHSKPYTTACHFSQSYSYRLAIGPASMAGLCFFSRAWSSRGMSLIQPFRIL